MGDISHPNHIFFFTMHKFQKLMSSGNSQDRSIDYITRLSYIKYILENNNNNKN